MLLLNTAAGTPEFSIQFDYQLYYSNRNPIPAGEVAESLLAFERVLQQAPLVMRNLVGAVPLPKVQLYVREMTSGSLKEDMVIKFLFGSKRQMDRTILGWRRKLGIDLNTNPGMLRAIIIGLILVGAVGAIGYTGALLAPQKAQIEVSHNTIINIGTEGTRLTAEDIVRVIDASVKDKHRLAADVAEVVKPAKRESGAEIRLGTDERSKLSNQTIVLMPTDVPKPANERRQRFEGVLIQLRAADRDTASSGWAAKVPNHSAKRLKLEVGPGIDTDDLAGKREITGTVELVSVLNGRGEYVPKRYFLVSVQPAP